MRVSGLHIGVADAEGPRVAIGSEIGAWYIRGLWGGGEAMLPAAELREQGRPSFPWTVLLSQLGPMTKLVRVQLPPPTVTTIQSEPAPTPFRCRAADPGNDSPGRSRASAVARARGR